MKKVVGLFLVLFTAAFLPAVSANEKPAIAIIDTAVDTSKANVVYEVCILYEIRCPNKKSFMEGPGAATLPASQLYSNGFQHGTIMSTIASAVNKDMNIVFIRIVSMTNAGRQGYYDENLVNEALNWVITNKTKFNIVAVSASVGNHTRLKSGTNYCPINQALRNSIVSLQGLGVATIFAAGNNYDTARVDTPACTPEAIAIGSVGERGNVENYSNGGPDLDFYALGTYNTSIGRAMGTSAATAAFAAYWAKNYKGSYQTTYDYLKSIGKYAEGNGIKTNLFVNVLG
jgi:hypothetical protein